MCSRLRKSCCHYCNQLHCTEVTESHDTKSLSTVHRSSLVPGIDMELAATPNTAARRTICAWKNDRSHEQIVFPALRALSGAAFGTQARPYAP